ncbi:MAG TPA: ABC transporter permease [Ignavibacteriales bacterium]|nr:ABC transporter permease [Ignavibacteriales bacterium]HOL82012.1 ABC transporter permease [Ignavibacteriales bacterium]HOM66108.1 ABC transporter permease [Ignavibacteriales bacterium]HPD67673.1 ABC transporter permease [Ignavibacteriales bacterium]HPP34147.1 ABC transporter permease [Ignavibacteriales bacterium]
MDNTKIVLQQKNKLSWILAFPALFWLLFFFFIPYLIVLIYSFLTPTIYDIKFEFTLQAYREIFEWRYIKSFLISLRLATITTVLCLLLGYPVAYFIARSSDKLKNALLFLIIIPFWTNFIIRIFSWRIFLAPEGTLNNILISLGIISEPLMILRTDLAVILVMVYVYLPYMILPLYAGIEKIDFTLINAAMDLGANRWKSFLKVTLPLSKEGIYAGIILVFIPSLGMYVVPHLVGSQESLYIGQIIAYKIKDIPRNWPLASALSFVMLLFVTILMVIIYKFHNRASKIKVDLNENIQKKEF